MIIKSILFILNLVCGWAWIRFLAALDQNRSEKREVMKPLYLFFAGGVLSAFLTLALYWIPVVALLDITLGDSALGHFIVTGPVEEFSKAFVFFFLARKIRMPREPLQGFLWAATVGLGFATLENLFYTWPGDFRLLAVRSLICTLGHMAYSGIPGLLYAAMVDEHAGLPRKRRTIYQILGIGICPGALLHGAYNALIATDYSAYAMIDLLICILILVVISHHLLPLSPYYNFLPQDHERAVAVIERNLGIHPDSPDLLLRLSCYKLKAGKNGSAMRAAGEAAGYKLTRPRALLIQAGALTQAKRYPEAEELLFNNLKPLRPLTPLERRRFIREWLDPKEMSWMRGLLKDLEIAEAPEKPAPGINTPE